MTTIAATRDALAGDAMVIMEAKSAHYPTVKIMRTKEGLFGAAGDAGDCTRFLDWAKVDFSEKKKPKFTEEPGGGDEALLLMVDKDGIYIMSQSDPRPELVAMDFYAIGSGGKAAMGALYAGAPLEKAMDIASAVDPYTRGPFTVLKLKEG